MPVNEHVVSLSCDRAEVAHRRAQRSLAVVLTALVAAGCSTTPARSANPAGHGQPEHHGAHESEAGKTDHEGHGQAGMRHRFADADEWAKVFDDPDRDAWQRPDDVLRALELSPAMTVADLGAGTGYFAVRLARAVPEGEVIATDIEPDMVRHLEERARQEKLSNLRALESPQNASGLAQASVDRILIVDVWHHLGDRVAYARDLAATLRPGGKLVIVDYLPSSPHGPPPQHRLAPEAIIAELEAAGWTAAVSPIELPYQYIIEARPGA